MATFQLGDEEPSKPAPALAAALLADLSAELMTLPIDSFLSADPVSSP